QQARETSQYTTNEHFFCCYDQLNRNSPNYYYPAELSKQLTGFVETGNQQQIAEIFKLIKKENLIKRSLAFNQINWLLSDIRNTLLKIRFSIPNAEATADSLKAIDMHFEEAPSMKLYEDLTLELCGLMGRDTSENQLIRNIKNYIAHNYTDPALCLSKISDEFSISESYFSFLFKKTSGENFSVYLEQLRMEQAIHLIKETNIKISDLYLKLGYNNPNSFRRAFKKVYGVSPNSIREADH
ncbi:MAG: AraC family transcriptional regulator, partial [Hungatella sp.]